MTATPDPTDILIQKYELEHSRYTLERKERISELVHKYAHSDDEKLGVIQQRMNPADLAEYNTLWDELGNIMVLGDAR